MTARRLTANGTRVAVVLAGVVAVAGCGGGATKHPAAAAPSASTGTTIRTHSGPLGTYLTDAQGRTLYEFAADKGTTSTCVGQCTATWPPLTTTGTPRAGTSATSTMLGTTQRTDGTEQVTYAGHPLYYYVQDSAAGDMSGQGLDSSGGLWWMLTPAGTGITQQAQTPSPAGSTSGGSGSTGGGWA